MYRRFSLTTILVIAVLLAVGSGIVMADEDLTLEGLVDLLASLAGRVEALESSVEALESIYEGPGSIVISDGECAIGFIGGLQDETVLKYKEEYDEWPDVGDVDVYTVVFDSNSNRIGVVYEDYWKSPERYVKEIWDGCDFVGSTDWWEE
jgi:hypothetical protein